MLFYADLCGLWKSSDAKIRAKPPGGLVSGRLDSVRAPMAAFDKLFSGVSRRNIVERKVRPFPLAPRSFKHKTWQDRSMSLNLLSQSLSRLPYRRLFISLPLPHHSISTSCRHHQHTIPPIYQEGITTHWYLFHPCTRSLKSRMSLLTLDSQPNYAKAQFTNERPVRRNASSDSRYHRGATAQTAEEKPEESRLRADARPRRNMGLPCQNA